ncbi:uncharacterized protein SCHCODRAFT_02686995 [Schizophyllum commune H4-8]|uniref:Carrier domain-containing protein n=1 Tax=Schizophyllum commune (strain H4-8 / FGSC 9210) TaxID=578458 RepID=D8Q1Z7_SCHCM|nr:uncharacterized protein SCHCODRAFT_02686995 [Schizophyllum commune H4-8]KAI5895638.1 hypothetical protein SCHCODRAFT_02686995 [Schizophyllum commune H4-8]
MAIPLSFLHQGVLPAPGQSLGDALADSITNAGTVNTLLDCLCATHEPAIFSPNVDRQPLLHDTLRSFVYHFALPHSPHRAPLGPNDRVVIALPTGPENALALVSLAAYHTCAPVNASCTAQELFDDAERLNARAIVTAPGFEDRLDLRRAQQKLNCDVVLIHARPDGPTGLFDMTLLDTPNSVHPQLPSRPHGLDDRSLVLHTSGTSGKKKVVPYTLRSLIVGTCAVVQSWALRPSDINMNMMPLFHVGGIVRNLLAPLLSGGSAIMCAGFDAIAFWRLAIDLKATWYYAAPTIHHAILTSRPEDVDPARDTHIRMICNAAGGLLPSLAVELKRYFPGAVVLPSYGMTECMPISTPPVTYQLERPGCSGIACGPYLSIRDPSNLERELPAQATGAVCVRGLPTFQGYEVDSDQSVPLDTSAFTSEGWFDSGDCGYMDEDGYLYITGRSKEIINKGGEVISPFEVEEAIMTAAKDCVKTTLAFAVEHDVLQEAIGVVIVPQPDTPRIGLSQLHNALKPHLHPSKWPFLIVYMNDLPKNNAGKPLRIKLAQRLNLGRLSDSVPYLRRHYEAIAPPSSAPLSQPIPSSLCTVDERDIYDALAKCRGISEIAVRMRGEAAPDVYINAGPGVTAADIKARLTPVLHGYALPENVHVLDQPLPRHSPSSFDYEKMDAVISQRNASAMSHQELEVRDIIARLLDIDPGTVTADSDFFLLGGNSLLLGKLSHQIRKQTGVSVGISELFTNSTVRGIARLVDAEFVHVDKGGHYSFDVEKGDSTYAESSTTLVQHIDGSGNVSASKSLGQNHPISLIVQIIPLLFLYPIRSCLTWTIMVFSLSYLVPLIEQSYWERVPVLLCSIAIARLVVRIVCPIGAIVFKWVVIGRYRPGTYKMWSVYHLRWWIVDHTLRAAGKGIFALNPAMEKVYYRLLGAKIGSNVQIDARARLAEYDLLHIHDDVKIDSALIRGFCVERDGFFRLGRIILGRGAVINTYTQVSPSTVIPDGTVLGPHASSHESASQEAYAGYNRNALGKPHFLLQLLVGWPIVAVVKFAAFVPWFCMLYLMFEYTVVLREGMNPLQSVIYWFAEPRRIVFHVVARVVRAVCTPLLSLFLGIIVKRIMGLQRPGDAKQYSEYQRLRRWINDKLVGQGAIKKATAVLGTHYQTVSIIFRMLGAKVGDRVYWPGSSVYCPDPELLEIGNDVVFGSRSEFFTSDQYGSGKIVIEDGAMIADRVVLLPDTRVGRQAVMGSGALGRRGGHYEEGSTWMGNANGEAICFNKGKPSSGDTITPFGRAYYKRQAPYFVFPYLMILSINVFIMSLSAAYWAMPAVCAAQVLKYVNIHLDDYHLLHYFQHNWYDIGPILGLNAMTFVVLLCIMNIVAILYFITMKWIIIGRRREGSYNWDKSNYCQRWQLHLSVSRLMFMGYFGTLGPLNGSAYIVWVYRALGATIGKDCSIFAGGRTGLMTEPDLVTLGDNVSLDDCSVVAHINSRGQFSLNKLNIGDGAAMRAGSRLLSGASMEENSMLCEHTLLTSGEIAEAGGVYVGWPGKRRREERRRRDTNPSTPGTWSPTNTAVPLTPTGMPLLGQGSGYFPSRSPTMSDMTMTRPSSLTITRPSSLRSSSLALKP